MTETETETEFVVTFGTKYAREPHPVLREAHPDAYVVITAPDYETANRAARVWLGQAFAFIYHPYEFDAAQYAPLGEVGRRSAAEVLA